MRHVCAIYRSPIKAHIMKGTIQAAPTLRSDYRARRHFELILPNELDLV